MPEEGELRVAGFLAHCAQSASKKGEGFLMPRLRLSMRGVTCRAVEHFVPSSK